MFEYFVLNLSILEKRMDDYYKTDYPNEEDDSKENENIKTSLLNLIIDANDKFKHEVITNTEFHILLQITLDFYRKNTGCVEDLEILEKILSQLLELNLIDKLLAEDIFTNNASQRWS